MAQNIWTKWDFNTIEELFDYIEESYINGQKKQAKEIYDELTDEQAEHFLSYGEEFDFKVIEYLYPMEEAQYGKGSTISAKADRRYRAYEGGRHKSKKFATIEMTDGTKVRRRNANQYGDAYGGRVYTENRPNRTDRRGKSRPDAEGTATTRNEARRTVKKSASKTTHKSSHKSSSSKAWEYSIGGL